MVYPQFITQSPYERLIETGRVAGNGDGELGSLWGDILGQVGAAATQVGLPLLFGQSTSTSGQAKGSAAIQAFGQQAIAALNQILQALQTGQLSPADAVSNAQRIAGALSDSRYVYQAQHGDDANILQNAKASAAAIVQQIQTAAATFGQPLPPVTVTNPTTGGTVSTPAAGGVTPAVASASPIIAGVDNSTLMFVGGGVLLFLLLK